MATIVKINPTGNGTNDWPTGTKEYTNVDEAVYEPSTPTAGTNEEIEPSDSGDAGDLCELTFSAASVADARITDIELWWYKTDVGDNDVSLALNFDGTAFQDASSSTGSGTGWYSRKWTDLGYDLASGFSPVVSLTLDTTPGKSEDTASFSKFYIQYSYDDTSAEDECYTSAAHSTEAATTVTLNPAVSKNLDDTGDYGAFQFDAVGFEQAETITSGVLVFRTGQMDNSAIMTLTAEDVDTAPSLTAGTSNLSNRTGTTASVDISQGVLTEFTVVGIDVTAILQELADRAGWSTGSKIVFLLTATDPAADDYSVEFGTDAILCIDHPTPVPGGGGFSPFWAINSSGIYIPGMIQ